MQGGWNSKKDPVETIIDRCMIETMDSNEIIRINRRYIERTRDVTIRGSKGNRTIMFAETGLPFIVSYYPGNVHTSYQFTT